jgi:hypothetical protein
VKFLQPRDNVNKRRILPVEHLKNVRGKSRDSGFSMLSCQVLVSPGTMLLCYTLPTHHQAQQYHADVPDPLKLKFEMTNKN